MRQSKTWQDMSEPERDACRNKLRSIVAQQLVTLAGLGEKVNKCEETFVELMVACIEADRIELGLALNLAVYSDTFGHADAVLAAVYPVAKAAHALDAFNRADPLRN